MGLSNLILRFWIILSSLHLILRMGINSFSPFYMPILRFTSFLSLLRLKFHNKLGSLVSILVDSRIIDRVEGVRFKDLVVVVPRVAQQNQMFVMNRQQADEDPNVITELMEADLVPLRIVDFDPIFEMNWLSRHDAHIDCYRKLVFFRPPGRPQVELQGERRIIPNNLISCLRA
nr:uncharacterized protein LOC108173114 [Malus domestica]